jgi:hypothetical protein
MIGFNNLGRLGRLGNQMFQYAGLRGIASNCGYDFAIPSSYFGNEWNEHQLFNAFKLSGLANTQTVSGPNVAERHFGFDEELFNNMPDNHNIYGYLQSEKYFYHISEEIREDFKFKDDIFATCENFVNSVANPIALHIRRGDYLSSSRKHPVLPIEYYASALSKFDSDRSVFVFSDDINWCKEVFNKERFIVSETGDNVLDLCRMSLCSDFIIANSSFSWWGSWLSKNPEKRIIAPNRWFGTDYVEHLDISDLPYDNWEIIDI